MGEILNEYFSLVFTVEKSMDVRELGELNIDVLRSVHITEEVVLEVLKRIKVDKSPEPECIPGQCGRLGRKLQIHEQRYLNHR